MRTVLGACAPPAMPAGGETSRTAAVTVAVHSEMNRSEVARTKGAWRTVDDAGGSTAFASSQATAGNAPVAARMTHASSPSITSTEMAESTARASAAAPTASGWTSSSAGSRRSTRCFVTTAIPVAPSTAASVPTLTRFTRPAGSLGSTARLSAGSENEAIGAKGSNRAVGVDPDDFDRHTALGDARWARAIYDAITGGPKEES